MKTILITLTTLLFLLSGTATFAQPETEQETPEEPDSIDAPDGETIMPNKGIYKSLDKNGQPIYTDKPHQYEGSELIKVRPGALTVESQTPPEVLDQKIKQDIEERKEKVSSNTQRWEEKKKQLQSAFEAAKKARAAGQETIEGDFSGYRTKNGGQACCRPSQQRLNRLKQLDENLQHTRDELRRHLKKNPKTYSEAQ